MAEQREPAPGSDGRTEDRGRLATQPKDLPAEGWKDVAVRVREQVKRDRVPLLAAGVAFYFMLAAFPSLTAVISVYGLVADPAQINEQVEALTGVLATDAAELIRQQATRIVETDQAALSLGFVVSLVGALWAASSGIHGLMQALTLAHNEDETRGFLRRRLIALGLTLVGIVFSILAIAAIVVVPMALGLVGLGGLGEWLVRILRWPLVAVVLIALLAVIYRYGPDRSDPRWRWVSWGAGLATVMWVVASIGFSVYVANLGAYNETYGALGGAIVLLLWLFISALVVILGAEVNAEMEHQTRRDTTTGEPQPMGQRGAEVADRLGERRG